MTDYMGLSEEVVRRSSQKKQSDEAVRRSRKGNNWKDLESNGEGKPKDQRTRKISHKWIQDEEDHRLDENLFPKIIQEKTYMVDSEETLSCFSLYVMPLALKLGQLTVYISKSKYTKGMI